MTNTRDLARVAEENLALVNAARAQAAGSEIYGRPGLGWSHTPEALWLPGCDRALLPPTAAPEQADELLAAALVFFAERAAAVWCTTTAQRTPPAWHTHLKAAGWRYQFSGTFMAADLARLPAVATPREPVEMAELSVPEGERLLAEAAAGNAVEHPYFGSLTVASAANEFGATLRMVAAGQARIFCARRGHEWLGSAMSCTTDNQVAGIYDVGVHPKARRQGIASALVRQVCEATRSAGQDYATLQNGHGLIEFYERLGFCVISTLQHWQRAAEEPIPTRAERASLREGADLTLERFLHHVFCGERAAALAFLRANPALAQQRQENGGTALHVTSFHGEVELTRALLASGAELAVRERDFGAAPLIHAVVGAGPWGPQFKTGQVAVIRALLAAGADPQAANAWGETAGQLAPATLPEDLCAQLGASA